MSQHIAMKYLLSVCLAVLAGCGGMQLGGGKWGPIGVDGVYECYGEKPIDPANCSPANVYVCNSTDTQKRVQVESYFSFGDSETRVEVVNVPPYAKPVYGSGPFVGSTEYKRLHGLCAVRQYSLKVLS